MAEVLPKSYFVSSCNCHKQQLHHHGTVASNTCCLFGSDASSCSVKRFHSLKLKPQVLTSSSLSSGFHGKNLVFRMNKEIPNRAKSLFPAQMGPRMGNTQKWWEKGLQPNMREVTSVQDLVDSLFNAGDKLVILDFFSPGCGGCRPLHPKIKKFKDALAKHTPDRCSLGPTKGLAEVQHVPFPEQEELAEAEPSHLV